MAEAVLIGVSGGSGSGKTTFVRELKRYLGEDRCCIIYQDSYYKDQSKKLAAVPGSVNFDHPESIEFSLLKENLVKIKNGETVDIPIYEFSSHTRKETKEKIIWRPVVLVDGILIFSDRALMKLFDITIFVDAPDKIRYERRLVRDVEERGRTPEEVKNQFEIQVRPMHNRFVEPSKELADYVVSGESCHLKTIQTFIELIKKITVDKS